MLALTTLLPLILAAPAPVVVALPTSLGLTSVQPAVRTNNSALLARIGATDGTFQAITVPDPCPPEVVVPVRLESDVIHLALERVWLRSGEFRVLVDEGGGRIREVKAPTPTTYRGTVQEWPGSRIAASIESGQFRALVIGPEHVWNVQPVSDFVPGAGGFVAVRDDRVITPPGVCPSIAGPGRPPVLLGERHGVRGNPRGGVQWQSGLAVDADVEYFNMNGSSVPNTISDIEGVINAVNVVYERDCLMTHVLTAILVRTAEPDPYNASNNMALLNEFRDEWNSNQQGVARDSVHLFTGREIDGNIIGTAWDIGVFCDRGRSYAFSQARYTTMFSLRTTLVAHELGHLLNARHCDNDSSSSCFGQPPCNIMCSAINQCNGAGAPNFDPCSAEVIRDFAASQSCFASPAQTVWVNFSHTGPEDGSYARPYNTLSEGLAAVPTGGVLRFFPDTTSATATINRAMTFQAPLGPVTIGQ